MVLSEAERLLKSKYKLYYETSTQRFGQARHIHSLVELPEGGQQDKQSTKMIIKQIPKVDKTRNRSAASLYSTLSQSVQTKPLDKLSALEKAKRVLAAEAKAREASKMGVAKQMNRKDTVKTLKRPMTKRQMPDLNKKAKIEEVPEMPEMHEHQYENAMFVSNLPDDCTEEELKLFFCKYGTVKNTRLFKRAQNQNEPFEANRLYYAFMTFVDNSTAKRIIEMSLIGKRPPIFRRTIELEIGWAKHSKHSRTGMGEEKPSRNEVTFKEPESESEPEIDIMKEVDDTQNPDDRNLVTYTDSFL